VAVAVQSAVAVVADTADDDEMMIVEEGMNKALFEPKNGTLRVEEMRRFLNICGRILQVET
jgi:hypothetical protein